MILPSMFSLDTLQVDIEGATKDLEDCAPGPALLMDGHLLWFPSSCNLGHHLKQKLTQDHSGQS